MTTESDAESGEAAAGEEPPSQALPGTMTFERITSFDVAGLTPVLHVNVRTETETKVAKPPTMELVPLMHQGQPWVEHGVADLWVYGDGRKYARTAWNGMVQSFRVEVEPAIGTWRVDELRDELGRQLVLMLGYLWIDCLERM